MVAELTSPQLLTVCVVMLTVISLSAAYFSYRMFHLNRQLLASVANVLAGHKKDIQELESVWAQLNADHKEVMKFVHKPVSEETPLPAPKEHNG